MSVSNKGSVKREKKKGSVTQLGELAFEQHKRDSIEETQKGIKGKEDAW